VTVAKGRTMTSQVVPMLVRLLGEEGLAAAKRVGLPADVAEKREVVVPLAKLDGYCDALAEVAGDPLFTVHLGQNLPRGAYGLIELTARAAPSLDTAMSRFAKYTPLLNDQILVEWERPRLRHSIPGLPTCAGRHCNEFYIALVVHLCGQMVDGLGPERVMMAHARHPHSAEVEAAFGCPVDWGVGANVVVYGEARLDEPLTAADPVLFQVLDETAALASLQRPSRFDLSSRVRARLPELLPGRGSLIERMAARLRMSGRTLQRKLEAEGTVFADLVEQHRRELALNLVRDPRVALADIAYRLGYSEPRAFIRAFKAWEGRTPGDVRAATA
jgi:AraC-like DNA-binding protein